MEDVRLPPSRRERFERRLQFRSRVQPGLQLLGNHILRSLLEGNLLSRLLNLNGLVDVVLQGRLYSRNLFETGEFNPAARLRMLSGSLKDALRVLEQRAFEERERARVLERDDDCHVLFLLSEAGLAPLHLLGQVTVEHNLPQLVCFPLPLFRARCFHRPTLCATSDQVVLILRHY